MKIQKTKFKKAFTLLEILIASSIFAVIMLITTGTVAQSSSYRSKLKTLREVNEETRQIADQITRDVRTGTSMAQVEALDGTTKKTRTFKNGLALLKCKGSVYQCSFVNATTGNITDGNPFNSTDSIIANTLIISTKDAYKIYVLVDDGTSHNTFISYGTVAHNPVTANDIITATQVKGVTGNKITSTNTETAVNFGGYCPDDSATTIQQPYVQFFITSRTAGYTGSGLPLNQKSLAQLRSMVTSRSYNN